MVENWHSYSLLACARRDIYSPWLSRPVVSACASARRQKSTNSRLMTWSVNQVPWFAAHLARALASVGLRAANAFVVSCMNRST